jgi:hypothetical protein
VIYGLSLRDNDSSIPSWCGRTVIKGSCAESEEKRQPVSDIDTGVLDSLRALDPDGRLEKRSRHRSKNR